MANALVWADLQARVAAAQVAAGGVVLPICWPNTRFTSPSPPRPWLLVEMTGGAAERMELGDAVPWLDEGQSMVHVLVPVNTGVDAAMDLVDQVQAMFRAPSGAPVRYTRVQSDPGGPGTDDGNYWRTSVTADWMCQILTRYAPK